MNIGHPVSSAHPTVAVTERHQLVINHLVWNMNSTSVQRHLRTADANTVASTILAIGEYLAGGNSNRPTCQTVRLEVWLRQLGKFYRAIYVCAVRHTDQEDGQTGGSGVDLQG